MKKRSIIIILFFCICLINVNVTFANETPQEYCQEVNYRQSVGEEFIIHTDQEAIWYEENGYKILDYTNGIIADEDNIYYFPIIFEGNMYYTDENGQIHDESNDYGYSIHRPWAIDVFDEVYMKGQHIVCNIDYELVIINENLYIFSFGEYQNYSVNGEYIGYNVNKGLIFIDDSGELYSVKVAKYNDSYIIAKEKIALGEPLEEPVA